MNNVSDVAQLVDAYIATRTQRLAADKIAAKYKEEESALKKRLIEIAIAAKTKSLGGSVGTVNYDRSNKPTVTDWPKLYEYIKAHDAFDLLQKRLGEGAVEERWEDGIVIPGVSTFPVDNLTISGAK
jgi:hypothetical protein